MLFNTINKKILMNKAMQHRFFLILLSIIAMVCIIGISFTEIRLTKDTVANLNYERAKLNEAATAHYQWGKNLLEYINNGSEFTGSLDPTTCGFGKFIYGEVALDKEEFENFISEVEPVHNRIHESGKKIFSLPVSSRVEMESLYINEVTPAIDELVGFMNQKNEAISQKIDMAEQSLNTIINIALASCLLAVLLITAFCIGTLRFINKEIVKPVQHIKSESEKLSNGDLSANYYYPSKIVEMSQLSNSLEHSTKDLKRMIQEIQLNVGEMANKNFTVYPSMSFPGEFSSIEASMAKMIDEIVRTMKEIRLSAEHVTSGSDSVSAGAKALANGATEQASSVEELSATLDLISSTAYENLENARNVDELSNTVGVVVANSLEQMRQLTKSILEIQIASSEIGKIIKTVDDIAFQSNILALNASVEAARAGQAGKGFAVVAEEVRVLSQKSAQSAKNISDLIQNSLKAVERGVELTERANKALFDVEEHAKQVIGSVTKIVQSTEKQFSSIEEVSVGINQISTVVQANAATSEQSAAISEELNGQALVMDRLISQFQLSK